MSYCLPNYKINSLEGWLDCVVNPKITYQARLDFLYVLYKDILRLTYLHEYCECDQNLIFTKNETFFNDDCYFLEYNEALYFDMRCNEEASKSEDFKILLNKVLKLIPSQKQKKRRMKRFIEKNCFLADRYCYFITYTFCDKELAKQEATRRKNVIKFFKSIPGLKAFAMNKDFGDLFEREHYHCILSTTEKLNFNNYKELSNIDFELCNTTTKDKEAISKYISKLTNHSVKTSTNYSKIFYFRSKNGS